MRTPPADDRQLDPCTYTLTWTWMALTNEMPDEAVWIVAEEFREQEPGLLGNAAAVLAFDRLRGFPEDHFDTLFDNRWP